MRIISKFRDYYDTVQGYGIDKSIVFLRKHYNEPLKYKEFNSELNRGREIWQDDRDNLLVLNHSSWNREYEINFESGLIGFCGKVYPVGIIQYFEKPFDSLTESKHQAVYSSDEIISFLKKIKAKKALNKFLKKLENKKYNWFNKKTFSKEIADVFFSKMGNSDYIKIFLNHKTPIFYVRIIGDANIKYHTDVQLKEDEILINPVLQEFNFYKIFDPYTAFQEISMFISGVLGVGTPETTTISDEDMKYKKGFDDWSFKNPPGKKRGRK